MRLTALGKVLILIVVISGAIGVYRLVGGPNAGLRTTATGGSPQGDSQGSPTGGSTDGSSNTTSATDSSGAVEIPFIITAAKKDWVSTQIGHFNEANTGKYRVVARPIPSREAMHAILNGKEKPVLWSPGSPIWPARLAQAWKQKNGSTIVDLNNPNGYRVFLRSPLVIMTTRSKSKFLRPLLGTQQGWQNLRKLSLGQIKTPFGPLNFSHADPLTSSSGMLTIGLILADYGDRTGRGGNLIALSSSGSFMQYLKELERGLIYDVPAEKGTTALTNAFIKDPSQYDFITAYESAALAAAAKDPNIAVIYPQPTAVSEHAVSLLSGGWVSPEQRAGAEAFMQFLGSEGPLRDGVKEKFRPAVAGTEISLASELSKFGAQGFQQTYISTELPPYEALNTAAYQWRIKIAKQAP
jgi:hypothetical protein